jgi:3'(2'), 5'-bisphosphate nucleotidase
MLERELQEARSLAREAGRIVLELYGTAKVEMKGISDPVTEADKRANAFIVERLAKLFPSDGIVAEESARVAGEAQKERCWVVDPLDGTKEFIAQNGEFSIMIGLAIGGRATLGAVYQPALDKLYTGVVGSSDETRATLEHEGRSRPLHVSSIGSTAELKLVASRSHRPKEVEALMARLGITQEAPSGSVGLKIGHIAERNADLYVHLSDRSCRWDACAPDAILHAAGGRFSDVLGRPFDYTTDNVANTHGIFACNAAAFEAVLPVVQAIARESGFSAG